MIFPDFPGALSFSRFSRSSGNPDLYITLTDFKLPRIDENLDLVDNFVTIKFQI